MIKIRFEPNGIFPGKLPGFVARNEAGDILVGLQEIKVETPPNDFATVTMKFICKPGACVGLEPHE